MEIKFSEDHTASDPEDDIGKFAHHFTSNTICHGINILGNALSLAILTRILGADGFGRVTMLLVSINFLAVFTEWLNVSITRFGREERNTSGRLTRTFTGVVGLLLINVVLVDVAALFYRGKIGAFCGIPASLVVILILVQNLRTFARAGRELVRAAGRMHLYGILAILPMIVCLIIYIFTFLMGVLDISVIIFAWGIAGIVCIAVSMFSVSGFLFSLHCPGWRHLWKVVNYSWPTAFSAGMYLLLTSTDLVFLRVLSGSGKVVGNYGFAAILYHQMTALPALLSALLFPLLVGIRTRETAQSDTQYYIERIWPNITLPMVLFLELPMVFSHIILLIPGKGYVDAEIPLILLCASACIVALRQPAGPLMAAFDFVRPIAIVSVVQTITNVGLNSIWVSRYGMVGAALATLVSSVVGGIVVYCFMRKCFRQFNHKALLLLGSIAAAVVICLAIENTLLRILAWCLHLYLLFFIIRAIGVFKDRDLHLAARIGAPPLVQKIHTVILRCLIIP